MSEVPLYVAVDGDEGCIECCYSCVDANIANLTLKIGQNEI